MAGARARLLGTDAAPGGNTLITFIISLICVIHIYIYIYILFVYLGEAGLPPARPPALALRGNIIITIITITNIIIILLLLLITLMIIIIIMILIYNNR